MLWNLRLANASGVGLFSSPQARSLKLYRPARALLHEAHAVRRVRVKIRKLPVIIPYPGER